MTYHGIVKRVSWFKSSLLLRIQIKYTNELQFLIKTKRSIFNWKVYTTDSKRDPNCQNIQLKSFVTTKLAFSPQTELWLNDQINCYLLQHQGNKNAIYHGQT